MMTTCSHNALETVDPNDGHINKQPFVDDGL